MAKQKKSLSRVDIFKEKIDQIFIKSGLKPSVWEYKNGYICYLPLNQLFNAPHSRRKTSRLTTVFLCF